MVSDEKIDVSRLMIQQMSGTSGGQFYWELVDINTGDVLIRSWEKTVGEKELQRLRAKENG